MKLKHWKNRKILHHPPKWSPWSSNQEDIDQFSSFPVFSSRNQFMIEEALFQLKTTMSGYFSNRRRPQQFSCWLQLKDYSPKQNTTWEVIPAEKRTRWTPSKNPWKPLSKQWKTGCLEGFEPCRDELNTSRTLTSHEEQHCIHCKWDSILLSKGLMKVEPWYYVLWGMCQGAKHQLHNWSNSEVNLNLTWDTIHNVSLPSSTC